MENTLKRWNERRLTVAGKAVILRTYAIATIVYLASMFPIPESYITRIHRACFKFLWSDKNELVCRETCHLPSGQGGLGIPDLHITRRLGIIKWIQSITDKTKKAVWLAYGRYWTGQALGCIRNEWTWLRSNLTPHGDPGKAPTWYAELITFAMERKGTLATIDVNTLSNRSFREMLLENRRHQPRCVAIWHRFIPRPKFIWKTLWAAQSDNVTKEFL